MIVQLDTQSAMTIFERCDAKDDIAQLYADTGDFSIIIFYPSIFFYLC
jgi:hypothetical protein